MNGETVTIPETTPWLRPKEAAAYIRRSRSLVYRMIREGELPSYSAGGKVLINKGDLDNWVRQGRTRTWTEKPGMN